MEVMQAVFEGPSKRRGNKRLVLVTPGVSICIVVVIAPYFKRLSMQMPY
jgi:hypothetical protein